MIDESGFAISLIEECLRRRITLATAESCTGGLIVAALTGIPGASAVVDRGFVTYSNNAKIEMLGVDEQTLAEHGAVSEQTALQMARGALTRSGAGLALSVTGIAGPGGGSSEKPVGLVWFAVALAGGAVTAEKRRFDDRGRDFIRRSTVVTALQMALAALGAGQHD